MNWAEYSNSEDSFCAEDKKSPSVKNKEMKKSKFSSFEEQKDDNKTSSSFNNDFSDILLKFKKLGSRIERDVIDNLFMKVGYCKTYYKQDFCYLKFDSNEDYENAIQMGRFSHEGKTFEFLKCLKKEEYIFKKRGYKESNHGKKYNNNKYSNDYDRNNYHKKRYNYIIS